MCLSPTTGAFSLEDFLLAKKVILYQAIKLISHIKSFYTDDLFFKLSLLFFFVVFVKLIVFNIDIVERLLEVVKYFIAVLCKRAEEKKSKRKTYKHQIGKKIVKVVSDSNNNNNNNNVKGCESKTFTTSSTLNESFKKTPPFKRIDLNLECGLHLYSPPLPLLISSDFVNKLYNPDKDEVEVEFEIMYFLTEALTFLGTKKKNATSKDNYLIRIKKVFFFKKQNILLFYFVL
jgi:hypothetical protein